MKINTKKTISAYILAILILSSFSYSVSAITNTRTAKAASDGEYTLLEPLPCIPGSGVTCPSSMKTTIDFRNYMQYAFNLLIGLAAAAAVFMMVWGGFKYMSTDSWSDKSEGLDIFKHAIYGLLLVLSSYLILKTIDPRLVEIPSNIVPTITLKKSTDFSGGKFYDQILSDAKNQQIATDNFINQAKQSRADIAELEAKRNEVYLKIMNADNDTSDEEIQQWQTEFESLTNQINLNQAGTLRLFADSSMSQILSKTDRELGVENAGNTSNFVLFYSSAKLKKPQIDAIIDSSIQNINEKINPRPNHPTDYNRIQSMKELAPTEYENLVKEAEKNKLSLEIRRLEATVANTTKEAKVVYVGGETIGVTPQTFLDDLTKTSTILNQKINTQISDPGVKQEFTTRMKNVSDAMIKTLGN